tara:strand:- start:772 stop:1191 length:420 start_codon:yes stop_codon:yes gene_type:complete
MKNKLYLSWNWVDENLIKLSEIIKDSISEYEYVTGIPRGGLIPGVCLSHTIGLKYTSYKDALNFSKTDKKKVLVVDDICDTGHTVLDAISNGFDVATLALRYSSPYMPDYYGTKITNDDWLVFPWENANSKTVQDYLDN